MVRNQRPALGSLSICTASYPPRVLALTRRIVVGALVTLVVGFAAARAAPAQERERRFEPQEHERVRRSDSPASSHPLTHAARHRSEPLPLTCLRSSIFSALPLRQFKRTSLLLVSACLSLMRRC